MGAPLDALHQRRHVYLSTTPNNNNTLPTGNIPIVQKHQVLQGQLCYGHCRHHSTVFLGKSCSIAGIGLFSCRVVFPPRPPPGAY